MQLPLRRPRDNALIDLERLYAVSPGSGIGKVDWLIIPLSHRYLLSVKIGAVVVCWYITSIYYIIFLPPGKIRVSFSTN